MGNQVDRDSDRQRQTTSPDLSDARDLALAHLQQMEQALVHGNVCLDSLPALEPTEEAATISLTTAANQHIAAWQMAARDGVPAARALLAIHQAACHGFCVPAAERPDVVKSLSDAGDGGIRVAYYFLGRIDDEPNRREWLMRAVFEGIAEAACLLAKSRWWFPSTPTQVDTKAVRRESAAWFLRAADMGSPEGCYRMAEAYQKGWGLTQNLRASFHWLRRAADLGHVFACSELLTRHYYGGSIDRAEYGHLQSVLSASTWLQQASRMGFAHSLFDAAHHLFAGYPDLAERSLSYVRLFRQHYYDSTYGFAGIGAHLIASA